jgi:hypothetical protein
MATWLVKLFILQFAVATIVSAWEQKWALAIYFLGAVILNIGVLLMGMVK